jgi:hypothetical protein
MTFNQTNAPAIVATTNNDSTVKVDTTSATTSVNKTVTYPRMFDRWNLPL